LLIPDEKPKGDRRTISCSADCADLWPTSKMRWSKAGSNTTRQKDRVAAIDKCQRSPRPFLRRARATGPCRPFRKDGLHVRNESQRDGAERLRKRESAQHRVQL